MMKKRFHEMEIEKCNQEWLKNAFNHLLHPFWCWNIICTATLSSHTVFNVKKKKSLLKFNGKSKSIHEKTREMKAENDIEAFIWCSFLFYAYLHLLVGILIPPSITHIRPSLSLHLLAFSSLHKKCFIWNSMMQKVNRQWFWSVSTDALLKPIHVIKLLFMSQFIEIDVKTNSWYFF